MSYTPTVWRTGDKVTSAKLNKLEQGVANAGSDIEIEVDSTLTQQGKAADAKAVGDALANKVDAVTGKGLSTNDYTDSDKNKLDGIASGATNVEIDTTLSITGKAADAKAVGDALANIDVDVDVDATLTQQGAPADAKAVGDALVTKLAKPTTDGTNGQVLMTDGNGGVAWNDALDGTAVESAVGSYINAHPEVIAVADGSITKEKLGADVRDIVDVVSEQQDSLKTVVDQSDTSVYIRRLGYINENGVFIKGSATTVRHYFIPVMLGTPKTIVIKGNDTTNTYIAFTTGLATTNNTAVSFAGDYTSRIKVDSGETAKFDIPENANWIYVFIDANDEAMPSDIYFIDDASVNTYKDIENALGGYWKTALTTADERRKYWWEGGLVTNAGYTRTLPVKTGQHIIITNNTSHSCQYVLLREALWDTGVGNPLNGTPIKYLNTSNITLRVDDFYVPDGYNYLTILSNQNSASLDNRWPTSIKIMAYDNSDGSEDSGESTEVEAIVKKDKDRIDAIGLTPLVQTDSDGWEIPNTLQQLNVIRKCNRYRFTPWTPLRDIPTRQGSTGREDGGFSPAGTPFPRGIPYSSNWQDYKYPGITVSTYTFLTAVNNPYSLAYTENLRHTNPQSAWGRKWVVANGTNYYGLVCCGLTAAATKSELVWNNGNIPDVEEFTFVDNGADMDLNLIKIGDVFNNASHAVVIYGIRRDANNNVSDIRICQHGGSFWGCDFNTHTAEQFKANYSINGWQMFRFNNLYKNTDFVLEPTDVDQINQILDDDSPVTYSNLPTGYTKEICTFAGDKASFALGAVRHLIVINYNLDGNSMGTYDRVRLYNVNDTTTPVGEWTVAQANATLNGVWDRDNSFSTDNYETVDMENHAVVVSTGTNPLSAGKYYAVLSDGTTDSANRTEFEVVDNSITSIEETDNAYKIKLQNKIVACHFGTLVANDGDPYFNGSIKHELTHEEEANKYILVPKSDLSGISNNNLYVRLHVKGDYGTAAIAKKVFN